MPKYKRPSLKRHKSHVNADRYVRMLQRTQERRDEQCKALDQELVKPREA